MKNSTGFISASMMCADLKHLEETIQLFEKHQVEYLHIDVMDGEFVPNFGLGIDYIHHLRQLTNIPLEIHLMITRPEDKLSWFDIQPHDTVIVHFESTVHVQRTLAKTKRYGCKTFLAINPATPIYSAEEVLDYIDGITLLTVNPGFAGQQIVRSCIKKAEKLQQFLCDAGYPNILIEVDGNISFENARILKQFGSSIFVAGTSSIFTKDFSQMEQNILDFRAIITA